MTELITTDSAGDIREKAPTVAVLPVGSFEQHGDILPLSTDTLIASLIARRIADDYGLFLLPPVSIACSHEHAGWPGTVSISSSTLSAIVNDVWQSLQASGYRALVVVNGHGGNYVLSNIVQEATTERPCMALFPTSADWGRARKEAELESDWSDDMHAGEVEVSILLHAAPQVVRPHYKDADHTPEPRTYLLTTGMGRYTKSGVVGKPSLATPAKGAAVLDSLFAAFAAHLDLLAG